jgi:hypothetical protein
VAAGGTTTTGGGWTAGWLVGAGVGVGVARLCGTSGATGPTRSGCGVAVDVGGGRRKSGNATPASAVPCSNAAPIQAAAPAAILPLTMPAACPVLLNDL